MNRTCSVISTAIAGMLCCGMFLESGRAKQQGNDGPPPYVQITSVTVEPPAIHKTREPQKASIIVQMIFVGPASLKPTVKVEVATATSNPVGNNVHYSEIQTVSINKNPTVLRFSVEANSQTVQGKLQVAASIVDTPPGVIVKDPDPPTNGQAELTTIVP